MVGILVSVGVTAANSASAAARQDATATASRPGSAPRALWVWETSDPQATVDFALASGIGQLYAAVPAHVNASTQLPHLTELSQRARAAGLRIDALGGDPGWIDDQAWVVDSWLRPALATGLFSGIHVDIEPYTTPAWQTQRAKVVKKYLATFDTLAAAAGGTPIEADIPFWFDGIATGSSTLDREVIRRTSGVTVMAYRNLAAGADGSIALAAAEVGAGDSLGKPVRIGQETTYLGADPTAAKQTFFGQTRTAMEVQLDAITEAFGSHAGFAGLAIHDAAGYAALAP